MEKEPKCLIIMIDEKMTKLMQAADMFEPWKVVAAPMLIAENVPTDKLTAEFKSELLFFGDYNTGETIFRKDVKVISNGTKWAVLRDFLQSRGWDVETDEHLFLTKVTLANEPGDITSPEINGLPT